MEGKAHSSTVEILSMSDCTVETAFSTLYLQQECQQPLRYGFIGAHQYFRMWITPIGVRGKKAKVSVS